MGKDLKGKELGKGINQRRNGKYCARFVDRFGVRRSVYAGTEKEVRKALNEAVYENEKQLNIRENIRLDDWYKEWMNVYKYDVIRQNTKAYYNTV